MISIKGTLPQIVAALAAEIAKADLTKILVCEIKLFRKSRSLTANAYFHVLVDKLRLKRGISFAACKNDLITSYGQIEYLDEEKTQQLIYKTNAPPEYISEKEDIHMLYIKSKNDDGVMTYFYRVYRGSHTYDTLEMSKLIDGTVNECHDEEIETLSPDELTRMKNAWKSQMKFGSR